MSRRSAAYNVDYYRHNQYNTSFNPYNIHISDMYYSDSGPSTPRPTILVPNNQIFTNKKEKPKTDQCCVIQ